MGFYLAAFVKTGKAALQNRWLTYLRILNPKFIAKRLNWKRKLLVLNKWSDFWIQIQSRPVTHWVKTGLVAHRIFFKVQVRFVVQNQITVSLVLSELPLAIQIFLISILELVGGQFYFECDFCTVLIAQVFRALNENSATECTCKRISSAQPNSNTLFHAFSLFLTRLVKSKRFESF